MNIGLTIIFARLPSSCALTSIVALSVFCRVLQREKVREGREGLNVCVVGPITAILVGIRFFSSLSVPGLRSGR
jgi:hypothetical protein